MTSITGFDDGERTNPTVDDDGFCSDKDKQEKHPFGWSISIAIVVASVMCLFMWEETFPYLSVNSISCATQSFLMKRKLPETKNHKNVRLERKSRE